VSAVSNPLANAPARSGQTPRAMRQRGWTSWQILRALFLVIGYGFVLGPVLPVVYNAFNASPIFPAPFEGLTLEWFRLVVTSEQYVSGAIVSIQVGLGATALALIIGVSASFAVVRGPTWIRGAGVTSLLMGPIVIPQIVIGLAILEAASQQSLRLGLSGLIIAHAVFVSPFVIRVIAGALEVQGSNLESAAMVLGSRRTAILFTLTLPMLRPAIVASAVFAFTLSFVNVPLSLFLSPSNLRPLPIVIYQEMINTRTPVLAAVSILLAFILLLATGLAEKVFRVRILK
jgi:putative spermidine/putrescine transport system permease protein